MIFLPASTSLVLQPHGIPLIDDRLNEGPHIALSLMRVNGYGGECERTYFVSSPTSEMKKMYTTAWLTVHRGTY